MLHAEIRGRLLILGCGSVGQGLLPLIVRHIAFRIESALIVTADPRGREVAAHYGIAFRQRRITQANHRAELGPLLQAGDVLVSVSVGVSSVDLVRLCHERKALYLDTVIEPWNGFYRDGRIPPRERSNYALRERMLALRRELGPGPTALIAHGANPGLVSHFIKEAGLAMRGPVAAANPSPTAPAQWARLFAALDVRAIHITESDTQSSERPKSADEFVNTWSTEGLMAEASQLSEVGWGTHETAVPPSGQRHADGCGAAIVLNRTSARTYAHSWTPSSGEFTGFLLTHHEVISTASFLTLTESGRATYRPTVCYVYRPSDAAMESLAELEESDGGRPARQRVLRDGIVSGADELGVMLLSGTQEGVWLGSRLSIGESRRLAPFNNATSLQVAAGILAGLVWAIAHPEAGIVEAEDIDHEGALAVAKPYLGTLIAVRHRWPRRGTDPNAHQLSSYLTDEAPVQRLAQAMN